MSPLLERFKQKSLDDRRHQTVIAVSRPVGFFAKIISVVAAILMLALIFVFSLILFAIVAAVVLLLLIYAWWVIRRAHRAGTGVRAE